MTSEELISFGCGAIFLFQGTALVLGATGTRSWRRAPEVVIVGLGQLSVGAGQWADLEATRAWAPWSDLAGAHLYWINIYAMPVPMLLFNHLFMGRGCGGSFAWVGRPCWAGASPRRRTRSQRERPAPSRE